MKFFLWFIAIVIILRMIRSFFRPFFNAGAANQLRQMQDQLREMDQKMKQTPKPQNVKKEGDYIDYEELK
jgi:hypothetical protein